MRYDNQKIFIDENKTRYLNRIEYPVIPVRDTDLFIQGQYGKRLDNLAFEYYGNVQLWWIIARANPECFDGGLSLKVGKEYRIPTDLSETGEEFITGGGQVGNVSGGY